MGVLGSLTAGWGGQEGAAALVYGAGQCPRHKYSHCDQFPAPEQHRQAEAVPPNGGEVYKSIEGRYHWAIPVTDFLLNING